MNKQINGLVTLTNLQNHEPLDGVWPNISTVILFLLYCSPYTLCSARIEKLTGFLHIPFSFNYHKSFGLPSLNFLSIQLHLL